MCEVRKIQSCGNIVEKNKINKFLQIHESWNKILFKKIKILDLKVFLWKNRKFQNSKKILKKNT